MIYVVLSIGSNHGDRYVNVREAREWLSEVLIDFRSSRIYETEGAGCCNRRYMNCVVSGYYDASLSALESMCKDYEKKHGRNEELRRENFVPVDIDVVVSDNVILKTWDFNQGFFKRGYEEIQQ